MTPNTDEPNIPLRLTQAQRRSVAGLLPHLRTRLLVDESNQRTIRFAEHDIRDIAESCRLALPQAETGMLRNSLDFACMAAEQALTKYGGRSIHQIPVAQRLFQFRIALKGVEPEIWRRIQVKDCNLDRFHLHIQLAMGWENYHLHRFKIDGTIYGDPELLCEGFVDDPEVIDSYVSGLSDIVPQDGKRFKFEYEYDFGDCWEHDVLFEGCLKAEKGTRYPICLEGERACPPEDVGGIRGYQEYLDALANPHHEEHQSWLQWRGKFDPENFNAEAVTKKMRRGRGNWPSYSDEM